MHEREYKREGERLQRHEAHDQLYVRDKRAHAVSDPRDPLCLHGLSCLARQSARDSPRGGGNSIGIVV